MRDKEKKHHKGQETTIGKIIYGFLLFMPLIAIGVTCGYAMFNKNAYQSYSDTFVENYSIVNSNTQYVINNTYQVVYNADKTEGSSGSFGVSETDLYKFLNDEESRIISYFTIVPENYARINIFFTNGENVRVDRWNEIEDTFYFKLRAQPSSSLINNFKYLDVYQILMTTKKLDNVFYYSVNKVTESPLFNWAQNSVIYTTTNTTCNALSITTPFIPLLMSYWLIISVIYFLYDIALMLVWLIHRKIHELQESL